MIKSALISGLACAAALSASPLYAQSFDCVITPAVTVSLAAPVGGLLSEVSVDRGDLVKRGQVVARLDTDIEETTVTLMRERAESRAEIEVQRARLNLAEQRMERVTTLVDRNISTPEALEEVQASVNVAIGELAMAEMRARIAELELDRAAKLVEQRTITSPINGVVQSRALFEGEFADQDVPIVDIAQLDPLHVEAFLPVDMYLKLVPEMTVTITPRPPLDGSYVGKLKVIDRIFDAASGTFGVRIKLPNNDLKLPAGHRCEVTFPE
ncbi:MAG: efflux RND transporter periplasmic adaptor subunit [Pseudomonadota bacterium]